MIIHNYNIRYQGIDLDDTGVYFTPDYPSMDKEEFDRVQSIMLKNIAMDLGNEITQLIKKPKKVQNDF